MARLTYCTGLEVVQSLLKSPSHPVRLCSADLVLAVTMDANSKLLSILLHPHSDTAASDEFLVELCKPAWARLLKSLLAEYITKARQLDGSSTHDVALMEKLSVIVQKLSKQRFTLPRVVQQAYLTIGTLVVCLRPAGCIIL